MTRASGLDVHLDLSGVTLRLSGLDQALADRVRREWAAFVGPPVDAPFVDLRLEWVAGPPPAPEAFAPKAMTSALLPSRAAYAMPEGRAEVDQTGRARVALLEALGERTFFTYANLVRACLAWRLPSRHGALLHAAGLVLEGRAFLLVGPESSGKSTWTRLGEGEGARVLSDDLVLLDDAAGTPCALGAPFRSTHRFAPAPGRWPIAAILFPLHAGRAEIAPTSLLRAKTRVIANLPFIAEGLERDPRIAALVDGLTARVTCAELRFAPDPSFVSLLRRWPTAT